MSASLACDCSVGPWPVHTGALHGAAGPVSSFLVISDPAAAKHVLRATDNPIRPLYVKGLVAEARARAPR